MVNAANVSNREATYAFARVPDGMPRSGIVEISGARGQGKTTYVLEFLKENPGLKVAWMEKDFTFNPSVLTSYGLGRDRFLFVELASGLGLGLGSDLQAPIWCASQILRSQLFQVLVLGGVGSLGAGGLKELDLRRLQLLSKQSGALVVLLQDRRIQGPGWMFSLRLEVTGGDRTSI